MSRAVYPLPEFLKNCIRMERCKDQQKWIKELLQETGRAVLQN
jgi:hypothetical protein